MNDWAGDLLGRLETRNRSVPSGVCDLVRVSQNLWMQSFNKDLQLRRTREQLIIAQHESNLQGDVGKGSGKQQLKMISLQEQLNTVQQELADKYKSDAEMAKKQLKLSEEHREMQKQRNAMNEVYQANNKKTEDLIIELESKTVELKQKTEEVVILREEIQACRFETEQSRKVVRDANLEKQAIVERTLQDKQKMIEELNEMTASLERCQRKIAQLEKELQEAKQATNKEDADAFGFENIQEVEPHGSWISTMGVTLPSTAEPPTQAHKIEITCASFTRDGKVLATGSSDGTVKLWSRSSTAVGLIGVLHASSSGVQHPIMSVHIRNNFVVGGGSDYKCRVWSTDTQRIVHTLTGHGGKIYAVRLTPDGRMIATGGTDRKIILWDMSNGYRLKVLSCGSICNSFDIGEVGVILASVHQDKTLRLWDIRAGQMVRRIDDKHGGPVTHVEYSRDERVLLTCCKDNLLRVFDAVTLELLQVLGDNELQISISWCAGALSPDAQYAAVGSARGTVFIWDIKTGKVAKKIQVSKEGHAIETTTWNPNGKELVSCDYGGVLTILK